MPFANVTVRYTPAEIAHFYETDQWRKETLPELVARSAARAGEDRVMVDDTTSLSYAQLHDRSQRLAAGMWAEGVRVGDRVSVQIPNWVEFAVIVAACARIGAVVVPIMPIYRNDEVGYILRHVDVVMAFTAPTHKTEDRVAMYDDLRASCPALRRVVVVRPTGPTATGARGLDELMAVEHPIPDDLDVSADDPFAIVFSSGTTARPKGCLHTLNTLGSSTRALARAIGYGPADVTFGPAPITHTQGLINAFLQPLLTGAQAQVMDVWDAGGACRRVESGGCTVAMTPPAMMQMMLDAPEAAETDFSRVRVWILSGAPVPPVVMERASVLMPNARILSAYGRTENITTTICTPEDDPQRALTSDGRALPHQSVRIVDRQGNELPRGQEGDIAFRGSSHMLEYVHDSEQTNLLFTADGYSRSGDLGVMDDDGYVRVSGRIKDIVIRGGLNISVRQVEDLLSEHPAVRRVAVVGMPDERLGERLCCFVERAHADEPLVLDDLTAFLRDRGLAVQKLPERLELIETMPLNPTGKIQKHLLRDLAAGLSEVHADSSPPAGNMTP